MIRFIKENSLVEVYRYIDIALRMLLCTPSSNNSTEKIISLKRVKTYLRSTTGENRINEQFSTFIYIYNKNIICNLHI
jgi:hypothetical protein